MTRLTAFLAWSTQAGSPDAVKKVLAVMKNKLGEQGFEYYDWNENQSVNKDIGAKVSDELLKSDMVILEGSTQRPNLAYEVGFAHALHLPLVVVKQVGSERLPENFGEPDYLSYPDDVGDENGFRNFEARFADWLRKLGLTTLAPGQRSARQGRNALNEQINKFINGYSEEHASLHLLGGWAGALARELDSGGASQLVVDADYYLPSFSSLRGWNGGDIRAIADLTDETEQFWTPDHPEEMTANVSERVFLIDWSWFFENEDKLARQIDLWRRHQARHRDGPYDIYIAAKEELRPGEVHPLGPAAVGHHLLLLDPDLIGGYRPNPGRIDGRQLVIERNTLRFASAAQFYDSIKARAVRFEPTMKTADLRRAWVAKTGVGHWDEDWTSETEFRSPDYFDHYERHIRCWIPRYDQMIRDSAATVFREILRIYADTMRSVDVLEIGYGTGRLTSEIVPWIRNINRPFYDLEHHGPVRLYRGVDRAEQMTAYARDLLQPETQAGLDMRLVRGTAWEDVEGRYDVVFGSLVMHFLIGPEPTAEALDEFFANCAEHTTDDGTLVFSDVFGVNGDKRGTSAVDKWREWMSRYALADDEVDGYLAGNADMTSAAPVSLLRKAAEAHGFTTRVKVVGAPTLPFRIVVFQKARPA
ncbi:MAG TPA: class I SAM-dependent methyltransferase [Amycolatopsis sp.]|nr:class I SAM-dependent methyltransferase [Amycolatopsis sp.]